MNAKQANKPIRTEYKGFGIDYVPCWDVFKIRYIDKGYARAVWCSLDFSTLAAAKRHIRSLA